MAEDTLTLDTVRVRRKVIIDGEGYELRDPDELSLREANRLQQMVGQVGQVLEGKDIEEGRMAALEAALLACVAAILPGLPEAVSGKLTDTQRVKLIQAFTQARGQAPAAGAEASAPGA